MSSREGETLSPGARLFHTPTFNCYVIAIMGTNTTINPQLIKHGLRHTLLKHPRFTSDMVKKGRKLRWTPTTVNLENHVIVPEIDPQIELPDRFVEDYISHLTKTPLDLSKPLWELHLLNIKTTDAEAVCIMRMHHSMGDGASLMSLLLAATRKTSDPHALPTVPTHKTPASHHDRSISLWWFLWSIWGFIRLMWNTLVDLVLFVLTILFIRDTETPLKGGPGVELNTKRFIHRNFSMDDIKLVKNAMKMTVNDVLLGVTQAGLTRYLNRRYAGADSDGNGGAAKRSPNNILKNVRLRATVLVNIRPTAGIQELADMMAEKSKAGWGNWIGNILLPFAIGFQDDPLEHLRRAKATMDRKKHSLESICTFSCAKLVVNLLGTKVAAAITRRVLLNTTMAFSNLVGPLEEISFYGHPLVYIAPTVYGHPHSCSEVFLDPMLALWFLLQALTVHFQSYFNKMTISLAVDPGAIPDPHLLCDDLEVSLRLIRDAVQKKLIADVVV